MMSRISALILVASSLSACTSLSACGKQETKTAASHDAPRMSVAESRMMALQPFQAKGRWYALINYGQGTEPVLVSEPSPEAPDRRLVRLKPGKGYVLSRIRVTCPHGGYIVRDGREADDDLASPSKASSGSPGLPIMSDLAKLCDRSAKVPTFEARLDDAVAKLRRMNNAMDSSASPLKESDLQSKAKPIETRTLDVRKMK